MSQERNDFLHEFKKGCPTTEEKFSSLSLILKKNWLHILKWFIRDAKLIVYFSHVNFVVEVCYKLV